MAARRGGSGVRTPSGSRVHERGFGRLIESLDRRALEAAVADLAHRDRDLAGIVARHGPPPMWERPPGFATLLHIILEQQVSLASARAAFDRLLAVADPVSPERFLALSDADLLAIGFSRQKARYGRALAAAVLGGDVDLDGLADLPDADVERALEAVPGIGRWTSTIYLLMVLRRPDVWPVADIALATAVADLRGLERRPTPEALAAIGDAWRPWRSVAARLLWHDYLSRRGRAG